jgi:hypothetical protein
MYAKMAGITAFHLVLVTNTPHATHIMEEAACCCCCVLVN